MGASLSKHGAKIITTRGVEGTADRPDGLIWRADLISMKRPWKNTCSPIAHTSQIYSDHIGETNETLRANMRQTVTP